MFRNLFYLFLVQLTIPNYYIYVLQALERNYWKLLDWATMR